MVSARTIVDAFIRLEGWPGFGVTLGAASIVIVPCTWFVTERFALIQRRFAHSNSVLYLLRLRYLLNRDDWHDWADRRAKLVAAIELTARALGGIGDITGSRDLTFQQESRNRFAKYAAFMASLRTEVVAGNASSGDKLRQEVDKALLAVAGNRFGDLTTADSPPAEHLLPRLARLGRQVLGAGLVTGTGIVVLFVGPADFRYAGIGFILAGVLLLFVPLVGAEAFKNIGDLMRTLRGSR